MPLAKTLTVLSLLLFAAAPLPAPVQDRNGDVAIPDVVERVVPAVVSIYSSREARLEEPFLFPFPPGTPPRGREQGMGSGVIVAPDGLILTNNHVVDRASDVRVVLSDRREFKATVVGTDPKSDLALLRVDARELPPLPFGDSSKVRVGETVLAVGNPLGVGQTVSKGIVSAKGRANVGIVDYEDFLQTDAAINPGNSGGALVNLKGELIGINTAIATRTGGFQGIGFAIPSNMAREVMTLLLKDGKVSRGQMGVLVQDMTPALARAMEGAPEQGVLVSEVQEGSPAEKAGLRRGDVLVRVDGESVTTASQLRNKVALRGAGAEVKLQAWRDGKTREFTVRLRKSDEPSAEARRAPRSDPEADEGSDSGLPGVSVTPATPRVLRRLGLPESAEGVVVSGLDPARVSPWVGLREGDLIVEANRSPVRSPEELRKAVRASKSPVLLTLRRAGGTVFVAVPKE
jgi:serine protease Do